MIEQPGISRHRGFTLIELLVSMAIFAMLAVLIFNITSQIMSTWSQAQARIEVRKTGRAVVEAIGRELKAATLPATRGMVYQSGTASPQSTDLSLQLLINPTSLNINTQNPQSIFWQAPIGTSPSGGMAEVGYFIRWTTEADGAPKAILCRYFVNPSDPAYSINSHPTNSLNDTNWLNDAKLDQVAPGIENADNDLNYKGWFADNVIGLWVRALDPLGNPIITNGLKIPYADYHYDSRTGYQYQTGFTSGTVISKSGLEKQGRPGEFNIMATLPDSIEVALLVLDSRSADRLKEKPDYTVSTPTTSSFWSDIEEFKNNLPDEVRQGARVFSTRVRLSETMGN